MDSEVQLSLVSLGTGLHLDADAFERVVLAGGADDAVVRVVVTLAELHEVLSERLRATVGDGLLVAALYVELAKLVRPYAVSELHVNPFEDLIGEAQLRETPVLRELAGALCLLRVVERRGKE